MPKQHRLTAISLALTAIAPGAHAQSDPASITIPDLSFTPGPKDEARYDAYFYFHRAGTDFATALADLRQCDGLAHGLTPGTGNPAIGGAALAGLSGAIASGNRRALARVNLRRCMFFKGYGRYGLTETIWRGIATGNDALLIQAKIASGATPATKDLGE